MKAVTGSDGATPEHFDHAVEVLRGGGLVVVPTDTVYGVAVSAATPGAVDLLAAAKGRPSNQPVAVLVADRDQAGALADLGVLGPLVARVWPGPVTLVTSRRPGMGALDLGGDQRTIGVRCPRHDLVRALAARVGPIATTSANRHGDLTPVTAGAAASALTRPVDLVLDGGRCEGTPSAVIDVTTNPWTVRRAGPLDQATLAELLALRWPRPS